LSYFYKFKPLWGKKKAVFIECSAFDDSGNAVVKNAWILSLAVTSHCSS